MLVAGIDIGSLCTKTVIADLEGKIISHSIIRSGALYSGAGEKSFALALDKAGLKAEEISYIVSTGYGRARVPFSHAQVTEITCHAWGIKHLFPDIGTIIDIGGQDSKVIYIDREGQVINFVMNDKCAAGTGRFLEVMVEALELSLEEMGEIWRYSTKEVEVSSICTVFAETEVISLLALGQDRADIVAGIFNAIARRIAGLVGQLGIRERVAMSGGVAKNKGVVDALERRLRTKLLIPEEPQLNRGFGGSPYRC